MVRRGVPGAGHNCVAIRWVNTTVEENRTQVQVYKKDFCFTSGEEEKYKKMVASLKLG